MRREELYLTDIVEAADAIGRFVAGVEYDPFVQDDEKRSAVLHKLTVIGEAAARLSSDFRQSHPSIEWSDIVAFRNIAVHAYFAIQWPIVWVTATQEVPELRREVAEILATEYPGILPSGSADGG
jgi:uncharacterized protein with HEPN domain